jgi:hypothetical protein
MKLLGFKYEPQRKGYYVDGHEKPATVAYRKDFVSRYLTEEVQMFRWIQITKEESEKLEDEGKIAKNTGYVYNHPQTNLPWVEYHVDTCDEFQRRMNEEQAFGGRPSVRRDVAKKMVIKIGHDEAIIKQFTLLKKAWYGPNGETALVPKDEGMGIMIRAMMSQEFGWGFELTPEQLAKVNEKRAGKNYEDAESATAKRGNAAKAPLTVSPFVREFEYGVNAQGYWSYEHMVMQLEDCIDCLKVVHPEINFVFLLDHSCGHDRRREDGLNVAKMSKSFGGKQRSQRDMTIKQEEGYLGPYLRQLNVGDIQKMNFTPDDSGPFWMTPEEKEIARHDITDAAKKKIRKYTKKELEQKLLEKNISTKRKLSVLQAACQNNGIPVEEEISRVVEGWEGKPKGMLQVLWERGFINTENGLKKTYKVTQSKDSMTNSETDALKPASKK